MSQDLLEKFNQAITSLTHDGIALEGMTRAPFIAAIYIRMFGRAPHMVDTSADYAYINCTIDEDTESEFIARPVDESPEPSPDAINGYATIAKLSEAYADKCTVVRIFDSRLFIMDGLILTGDEDCIYGGYKEPFLPEEFRQYFVDIAKKDIKYMSYVIYGQGGFSTMRMEVLKQNCCIETNYNDDLPYDQMFEFIQSSSSGLAILYGIAGSGKTALLRHLIYEVEKEFLFIDSSVFNSITDASFVKLLINHKNKVIVLEDCEVLVRDRIQGNNGQLAALLNLSDGILGDSLGLKFICTFNTDLTKIDKALLRKGRLKLKYEFKKLTPNKVQTLATKLNISIPENTSLPLCDVYNYNEENGHKEISRPIGFN